MAKTFSYISISSLCLWLKSAAEHANSGISLNKIVFVTHRDALGFWFAYCISHKKSWAVLICGLSAKSFIRLFHNAGPADQTSVKAANLYCTPRCDLSFLHFTMHVSWLNIWQTHHEKRWNSLHIVCEEDQRGRDFPQLRHEFVRSAPFHVRLSVSLAPQSVLLRSIHCHVLLLTTFTDGKCLVSSYCQGSINYAILPSCYPCFPISSHLEGQIPFYI